jgi:hypothetical protein
MPATILMMPGQQHDPPVFIFIPGLPCTGENSDAFCNNSDRK